MTVAARDGTRSIATGVFVNAAGPYFKRVGEMAGVERRPIVFERDGMTYRVTAGELIDHAAEGVPSMLPEVLYDLAVIRLANEDRPGALIALQRAVGLNPRLAGQALGDDDLEGLGEDLDFLR